MKSYPVIFSAPMVHALLEGRKTQTRRLVTSMWANVKMRHEMGEQILLYARETWGRVGFPERSVYRANLADDYQWGSGKPSQGGFRWRPSIHMPRWASRITLEVTDVRLQLLQAISEEDAKAEGLFPYAYSEAEAWEIWPGSGEAWRDPRDAFKSLWRKIHSYNSWAVNEEVIALTFRVHQENVDTFIQKNAA